MHGRILGSFWELIRSTAPFWYVEIFQRHHGLGCCSQVWCNKDPRHSGSCPSVVKRQQIQAELVKVQGTLGRLSKETKRGHCIEANGNSIETIKSAKVLGVTIRGNLKWNDHIDNISVKASQRIYLLKKIKRAGIDRISLIHFNCACNRSVLEYTPSSFSFWLTSPLVWPNREGSEASLKDHLSRGIV